MSETNIVRDIMLEVGNKPGCRVFRNNTGFAWQGKTVTQRPDLIVLQDPRPIHVGLCPGSSDLIGWKSVEITPDMVGKRVAVFTAIEVKTKTGRASDEQKRFIAAINDAGGFAGVARTPEEARAILK